MKTCWIKPFYFYIKLICEYMFIHRGSSLWNETIT